MAESNHGDNESMDQTPPPDLGESKTSTPEYRSKTDRKPPGMAAQYSRLYRKDQGVWLIGARSLKGPYTINKVNSNGTYQLNDEHGNPFKDNVKEKDLKPL